MTRRRLRRWDEKPSLRRDAIRSQGSTRSRRNGKDTGLLIPSAKRPYRKLNFLTGKLFSGPAKPLPLSTNSNVLVPESIISAALLRLSSGVSRKVPLATLVFRASSRLRLAIPWAGVERQGIAPLIGLSKFIGVLWPAGDGFYRAVQFLQFFSNQSQFFCDVFGNLIFHVAPLYSPARSQASSQVELQINSKAIGFSLHGRANFG